MAILYALIARGKVVLAEYTSKAGNFPNITRVLLGKISTSENGKMSYVYDKHFFHYVVEDGIVFLCLADQKSKRRVPFAFLEDIKRKFRAQYGLTAHSALAFAMNERFSPILQQQMDFYNSDSSSDRMESVRNQLDETRDVMVQNIEKVIERGDKVELLVDKTDQLNQQAFNFDRASRKLQREMYWRKVRMYAAVGAIIFAFVMTIVVGSCGGMTFEKCRST